MKGSRVGKGKGAAENMPTFHTFHMARPQVCCFAYTGRNAGGYSFFWKP